VSYLLDTNLLSEATRPSPDAKVLEWLASADEDELFVSAISFLEIRYGIQRMAAGRKRSRLDNWYTADLRERFTGRVLPVDIDVADVAGRLIAESENKGRQIETRDSCIAATAVLYGLTLVTRNVSDFEIVVKSILSPWGRGATPS
jgi:toxin FitB